MKIWCLANVKYKFVQKMEVYYGANHEDVKHSIRYKIIIKYEYKNKNHIVKCDKK